MSISRKEPRLVVQSTNADEDVDSAWSDQRDYHIAASTESENNVYIGDQINKLIVWAANHPNRWWRIVYRERQTINTNAGEVILGATEIVVTDNIKSGVHNELFYDRNSDGYYELNQGMPMDSRYPRFYTPADLALGSSHENDEDEPVGVKADGAIPGEEVEGEDESETVYVQDGDVITVFDELGHEKTIQISVI